MAKAKKLSLSARKLIAGKLMVWANMVFAGLVLAQAFFQRFDVLTALAGVVLFIGAYLLAVRIMRGGEE